MSLAGNIKSLRKKKGMLQKQVAAELGLGISYYNKIENGQREVSVKILDKLAKLYGTTIDNIVNMNGDVPEEITIEDKTTIEQVHLIQQLDDKEREIVFKMIDLMLTKKKFQDFFKENVAQ